MAITGRGRDLGGLTSFYENQRSKGRRGAFAPLLKKPEISGTASRDAFTDYFFPASDAINGYIKVWLGSSWQLKPVKYWTGSAWVQKPIKYFNGSSWVQGKQT
jgi:hypothetical protein